MTDPNPRSFPAVDLVDSHAHLTDGAFDRDRDEVVRRAVEAGVRCIVSVGIDAESSRRAAEQARNRPGLLATAGIHPHEAAGEDREEAWAAIGELLSSGDAAAVGEVGLDFHYDHSPPEVQRRVFRRSIETALEHGLPLVIHCRDAHGDLFRILEEYEGDLARSGRPPGVLHCFSGDADDARRAVEMGFLISFSGILTFRNAAELRAIAAALPEDRLLVETDSPWLAPAPRRGGRNEPARVRDVFQKLCEVRGGDPDALASQLWENAARLFGALPVSGGSM